MRNSAKTFSKNILVIDPDHELCKSIGLYLQDAFNVYLRYDLDYLDYTIFLNNINLILIDVDALTPYVVNNLQKVKKIYPQIKFLIMYTLLPENSELRNALRNLADGMIAKPFDVECLRFKIDVLLENPTLHFCKDPVEKSQF